MTIDERLDELVKRHEALTQTVGHLAIARESDGENIRSLAPIASTLPGTMTEIG